MTMAFQATKIVLIELKFFIFALLSKEMLLGLQPANRTSNH